MSMRYIVFLGAPSPSSTPNDDEISYQWRTIASTLDPDRRISALTENVIFADEDGDGGESESSGDTQMVEEHLITDGRGDQTTLITWAGSTQPEDSTNRLLLRTSMASGGQSPSLWQHNNLETQLSAITTTSYVYSDTSSIGRFPNFQFSLGTLSELASAQGKTCLLLAVLEVEGPDEVTVRRGPDAGRVVSVLRLIVGDEASTIRKLTAWREVAEAWGGATQDAVGIRCGDVVYFENVLATLMEDRGSGGRPPTSETNTAGITASLNLHSRAEICYRTMPRTSVPADMQLRPDLRLGASDAAVRRVAAVVSWFERMAGLSSAHGNAN
ncbi:hypothetical protein BGY98DRAFT_1106770 [Russula aff. rugulosa BPL654]|nr:hypothetical protein BGY98DRAFT_1106770 [Russula aff. rugulosa BPL654]